MKTLAKDIVESVVMDKYRGERIEIILVISIMEEGKNRYISS